MTKLRLAAVVAILTASAMGSIGRVGAVERAAAPAGGKTQAVDKATNADETDAGALARRRLDAQAERLEAEARRAMQSICRGC